MTETAAILHDGWLWTGDLAYDNPSDIVAAGTQAAQSIFPDWQKYSIVNIQPAPKK